MIYGQNGEEKLHFFRPGPPRHFQKSFFLRFGAVFRQGFFFFPEIAEIFPFKVERGPFERVRRTGTGVKKSSVVARQNQYYIGLKFQGFAEDLQQAGSVVGGHAEIEYFKFFQNAGVEKVLVFIVIQKHGRGLSYYKDPLFPGFIGDLELEVVGIFPAGQDGFSAVPVGEDPEKRLFCFAAHIIVIIRVILGKTQGFKQQKAQK